MRVLAFIVVVFGLAAVLGVVFRRRDQQRERRLEERLRRRNQGGRP